MFLLVSGRHAGAHPVIQMGTSMASPHNLGKKISPHILLKKNCCDLNIGESLNIFTFVLFPDSELNLLNNFDF